MLRRTFPFLGLACVLAALSYWLYCETIALPPAFIHAWTQSDRYALALGFLQNDFNLFLPQTYNLATVGGVTAVDLPLHEYLIALIMGLSGSDSPTIFRVYTLIYCCVGYLGLSRWGNKLGIWWGVGAFVAVFVFLLPVMGYFQAGFSPSATSLATALLGYGAAIRFWRGGERRDWLWAVAGLTLAALCRMPFNIFLFAFALQTLWNWWKARKIVYFQLWGLVGAYALVFGQHFYKMYVQSQYGSQFLTSIMPARSWAELQYIAQEVGQRWTFQYFSGGQYVILGVALVLGLVQLRNWRSWPSWKGHIFAQAGLISGGSGLYMLLMARQYIDHEYYFIDSGYLPAIMWLFWALAGIDWSDWRRKIAFLGLGLPLLGLAAQGTQAVQQQKYAKTLWDRGEQLRHCFQGAAEWLDGLQISPDARILVLDAYSTNAPLIAMRRRGYTTTSTAPRFTAEALTWDFDYIVCADMFFASDVVASYPQIVPHLRRIAGRGGLSLYKYSAAEQPQTLADLLGLADESAKMEVLAAQTPTQGQEFMGIWKGAGGGGLLVEAYFAAPSAPLAAKLVVSAARAGETLYYWEMPLQLRPEDGQKCQLFSFYLPETLPEDAEAQCYIWNPSLAPLRLDSARVYSH